MRLNKDQVQKINYSLLKEDKIYDNIIRLELVDHIASILEESDLNFEESFKNYWNSKEKVLLITQAKKQIDTKKNKVEVYFWKRFINPFNLLLVFGTFTGLVYLLKYFKVSDQNLINGSSAVITIIMFVLLAGFIIEKILPERKYFYTKKLITSISIYYFVYIQVSRHIYKDIIAENTFYSLVFLFSLYLYFVSFFFLYKTQKYIKKWNSFKILNQTTL